MSGTSRRVLGVVVTYCPDRDALFALVEALAPQVNELLLIDNTPEGGQSAESVFQMCAPSFNIRIERLGENIGIAAAQNIGIREALENEYDYVLLSDQDSIPAKDMVRNLVTCAETLRKQDVEIGCVCPAYFDKVTGQVFSFQVQKPERLFYSTIPATHADPWVEIVVTISSGSLIPVTALRRIGGMRIDFFIDHVDTEWCHRARAAGLHNFGTVRARLDHRLGDASFRVWYFGWREHSEYSPLRLYYRFRNFILLCKLPHVPLRWSIRASWYWLGNIYAHVLFGRNSVKSLQVIAKGLWDGIKGKRGPAQT